MCEGRRWRAAAAIGRAGRLAGGAFNIPSALMSSSTSGQWIPWPPPISDAVRSYGIMRHMPRAVRVLHEKIRTAHGVVVEFKVWKVPKSVDYPEGVKYSFFAAHSGKVLVGYDNHAPKGHHRHLSGEEEPYDFDGFDTLRRDFARDLGMALKR